MAYPGPLLAVLTGLYLEVPLPPPPGCPFKGLELPSHSLSDVYFPVILASGEEGLPT